jgi:hypothetical protein
MFVIVVVMMRMGVAFAHSLPSLTFFVIIPVFPTICKPPWGMMASQNPIAARTLCVREEKPSPAGDATMHS